MNYAITFLIIVIALIGAPLFAIIGIFSVINFHNSGYSILIVGQEIASKITSVPMLHSIPLFTFAGYILASSKASERLVRFTKAALGWMPGGLAIVTLLTCAVFTAFTGASGVTIVALGGLLLPALLSEKYKEEFSIGLVTTSGSLGLLFPPSLPLIIFGVVAAVNIDELFVAGFIPGVFLLLVLGVFSAFMGNRYHVAKTKFDFKEFLAALWNIKWELPLPILLFAGIYSGKLALSDAAPFTAVYVLVVEVLLNRDIKIKELPSITKKSMILVGAILVIMAVSFAATNYIVYQEVPQNLFKMIQGIITNKYVFLILLNVFLLGVGCIMDIFSALVVVVPIIYPIAYEYNIDLVHLGIIFLANLEIGYLTPPVGMNLFISAIRFKKPIMELYRSSLIFIGLLIFSLIVITYVPAMSLWFIEKPSICGQWEYVADDGKSDYIVLKSNGNCYRKRIDPADMMTMLAGGSACKYRIDGERLYIGDDSVYKFEIYNSGKRLLLVDEKAGSERVFYVNKVMPPVKEKTGNLIGKWIDESNGDEYRFEFSGQLKISSGGNIRAFYYNVEGKKLTLKEIENVSAGNNDPAVIYTYSIKDGVFVLNGTSDKKESHRLTPMTPDDEF